MNDHTNKRVHWSFWTIGVVALFWNGMGVANYFVQMNPDMLEMYRESERAFIEGRPAWATAGFALAVFGGTFGAALLLLRRKIAFHFFIASLIGTIIAIGHSLGSGASFGPGEIAGIIVMPLSLAVFLIWYSKYAGRKDWVGQ
jgi:hypothetical protein